MVRVVIGMVAILMGCSSLTGTSSGGTPVVVPSQVLVISGPIGGTNLMPLQTELLVRADRGDDIVQLVIDSPGGEINAGLQFITVMDAVRARGVRLQCLVPTIAASMAYQILLHCDERHVLDFSMLLWHRARIIVVMGVLSSLELQPLAADLTRTDAMILSEVTMVMGDDVPLDVLEYHLNHETLHLGRDLAALAPHTVITHQYIPGLLEALSNKSLPRNAPLGDGQYRRRGSIIYIAPQYTPHSGVGQ